MYELRQEMLKATAGPSLTFWIRRGTSDLNTVLSVLRDDEYRVARLGIEPGAAYVDVGSHIGSWAVLVAALGGEVWCYEPIPENLQLIIKNARENGVADRVHARWAAVAVRSTGYEKIYYANPETESGLHHRFIGTFVAEGLPVDTGPSPDFIHVPRVDFGRVLAEAGGEVDVMKIDCEGAEWGFLGGAAINQLKRVRRLVGEHHAIYGHLGGRAMLLALCRGVYADRSGVDDSKLGFFHFEREGD